ncbi:MAG: hypothetical protein JNJ45_01190 [Chthonomonas sp.]|nr:hypothetical protein [Chthonomonas sp.]
MKNQTEWIIRGVFAVIAIGVICYSIFGAREPISPPEPEKPPLGKVALPTPAITYKNELPAGDSNGGGGGGGGAPFGGGGPPLPGGAGAPTRAGK